VRWHLNNMGKNLLVSFSGGETSGFMSQWIKNHLDDMYDEIVFVFANTGLENEQTLEFVQKCDKYFKLNVQWVEASVYHNERKGTGYTTVDFETASRKGEPFEEIIKKYGIPNQAFPHCTRELKLAPINKFAKVWFNGEKYDTAIGIRIDEIDRMNDKYKEKRLVYPLIHKEMMPTSKQMVNFYWKQMPFRLELKGYQGNCVNCWKKSNNKLYQIANENPKVFDFTYNMELKYGNPNGRKPKDKIIGYKTVICEYEEDNYEEPIYEIIPREEQRITFFRNHKSSLDILKEAKQFKGRIKDDSINEPTLFDNESCEVFSSCGD